MNIKLLLPLFVASRLMAETFILNSSASNFESIEPLERDHKKEIVYDPNTNLMWQDDKTSKTIKKNWQGAIKHCENLKFTGFNDWRLPTITELKSIVDYTKENQAIIDGFKNVTAGHYWSSSLHVSDSTCAWYVPFNYGDDYGVVNSNPGLVRCVRDSN